MPPSAYNVLRATGKDVPLRYWKFTCACGKSHWWVRSVREGRFFLDFELSSRYHPPTATDNTHRCPHPHQRPNVQAHGNCTSGTAPQCTFRRLVQDLAERRLGLLFLCTHGFVYRLRSNSLFCGFTLHLNKRAVVLYCTREKSDIWSTCSSCSLLVDLGASCLGCMLVFG